MGAPTFAAYDPTDVQAQTGVSGFNRTVIVAMDGQTARVSTGTNQLVELEIINSFIIKIL